MKNKKKLIVLIGALATSACALVYEGFEPLEEPVPRPQYNEEYISTLVFEEGREQVASIGDTLFSLERFTLSDKEVIVARSHPELRPFPSDAEWTGTHYRDSPEGHRYVVYTTPDYYHGNIGVLLDAEGKLATTRPIVQVRGGKAGRGWPGPKGARFFSRVKESSEVWGLRYGGKKGGDYQFEVIDQLDPRELDIVQEINITPEEFKRGFVVKKVLVRGLDENSLGVITYTVTDLTAESP